VTMCAPLAPDAAVPSAGLGPSRSWAGGVALAVLTALLVGLGVYPSPLLGLIRMSVASLH
jgi:hypothetical protein